MQKPDLYTSIIDRLIDLHQQNPDTDFIDLNSRQIQDFHELLEILNEFGNLRALSLQNNLLSSLPQNLSSLHSLEVFDLRHNPLKIQDVFEGLNSIPSLRELHVDISLIEAEQLRNFLGEKVLVVNQSEENEANENEGEQDEGGEYVSSDKQKAEDEIDITLRQEDLEQVAMTFDSIRELYRKSNPNIDVKLADEFDKHVKEVMLELSGKLEQKFAENIVNADIIKAKYQLYEICFSKIIDYVQNIDPKVAQVLQIIKDTHLSIFKDLSQVVMGQPAKKFKQQFAPNYVEMKEEKEQLKQQVLELQQENKKYLNQIIRHSKGIKQQDQSLNQNVYVGQENQNIQQSRSISRGAVESPRTNQLIKSSNEYSTNQSKSQAANQSISVRTLTIRQLKEIIDEIYKSKQMFDKKYLEAQLPRETMEQHMYTYLNQKYGLKSIIIEWATAIINGIRKFSSDDNDIAVFGKILRNECDEEFRFVQNQVKNTIQELLKMYLRGRYPYKHNSEIKEMLNQKVNGWIYEEEAVDIIKYMYNTEDSETLIQKLSAHYSFIKASSQTADSSMKKKFTREQYHALLQEKEKAKIEYIIFQKIILDFQLKSHEKFLKKFIQIFRSEDKDLNGVIDETEFRNTLALMQIDKDEAEIQRFLSNVDPYNKQSITFSQCVTLFSAEVIEDQNGQVQSILQKVHGSAE